MLITTLLLTLTLTWSWESENLYFLRRKLLLEDKKYCIMCEDEGFSFNESLKIPAADTVWNHSWEVSESSQMEKPQSLSVEAY